MENTFNGLDLIGKTQANLGWFINTSHFEKLSNTGQKLLRDINSNLISGIENTYHFHRFFLFQRLDNDLKELSQLDPEAQAIDFRVVYNLPKNELLNHERIIKNQPYDITYHG